MSECAPDPRVPRWPSGCWGTSLTTGVQAIRCGECGPDTCIFLGGLTDLHPHLAARALSRGPGDLCGEHPRPGGGCLQRRQGQPWPKVKSSENVSQVSRSPSQDARASQIFILELLFHTVSTSAPAVRGGQAGNTQDFLLPPHYPACDPESALEGGWRGRRRGRASSWCQPHTLRSSG